MLCKVVNFFKKNIICLFISPSEWPSRRHPRDLEYTIFGAFSPEPPSQKLLSMTRNDYTATNIAGHEWNECSFRLPSFPSDDNEGGFSRLHCAVHLLQVRLCCYLFQTLNRDRTGGWNCFFGESHRVIDLWSQATAVVFSQLVLVHPLSTCDIAQAIHTMIAGH